MVQKYDDLNENQIMMNILVDCIDYIYDKENIYYAKDTPRKELEEFVDNLQQKDIEKFEKFFDTLPEIKKETHFKCPKCGYEEDIVIKGMQNFFV
jgi:rubrerythrin